MRLASLRASAKDVKDWVGAPKTILHRAGRSDRIIMANLRGEINSKRKRKRLAVLPSTEGRPDPLAPGAQRREPRAAFIRARLAKKWESAF